MKSRIYMFAPLATALVCQFLLLQQYEAGRRTWLPVIAISLLCSVALLMRVHEKRQALNLVCLTSIVLITAISALAVMLATEKVSRPTIQIMSRDMLVTIPFMLLLAGGWITGLGAVISLWLKSKLLNK